MEEAEQGSAGRKPGPADCPSSREGRGKSGGTSWDLTRRHRGQKVSQERRLPAETQVRTGRTGASRLSGQALHWPPQELLTSAPPPPLLQTLGEQGGGSQQLWPRGSGQLLGGPRKRHRQLPRLRAPPAKLTCDALILFLICSAGEGGNHTKHMLYTKWPPSPIEAIPAGTGEFQLVEESNLLCCTWHFVGTNR